VKNEVLAYTVTYGDRLFLKDTIDKLRGTAGMWFDWSVYLGNGSVELMAHALAALHRSDRTGIQYLQDWECNRGQHHATREALALAKKNGYKWLLRLDDDLTPRTKRWLKKMVTWLEELKKLAGDDKYRIVAAPKIIGLRNPLQATGVVEKGQKFTAELMPILGGACRIHSVEFLSEFEPMLYAPVGRMDPESIAQYTLEREGLLVRFPNIRMVHRTNELEAKDTPDAALLRRMGHYWCFLGEGV
jgi:hypothetical protein